MGILEENIFKYFELDKLPPEQQQEVLLKIGRAIFEMILIRILNELSEEEQSEFEKIVNENPNNEEPVLKFLNEKIPNLNSIVEEEVVKFRDEVVNIMSQLPK